MRFDRVVAALVKEPWQLSHDAIGRLTPYQLRYHFFKDWAEEGDSDGRGSYLAPRELFWHVNRNLHGLTEEETQARWDHYLRSQQQPPPSSP